MAKYEPLTKHLLSRQQGKIAMTFPELEHLLGFPLPPSARKHRAWWSNNPSNSVMTKAWLAAGYQSREVDLAAERLEFVRLNAVEQKPPECQGDHPLWGAWAGMITIAPGVDLTDPMFTDEEVDEWLDEKAKRIAEGMR